VQNKSILRSQEHTILIYKDILNAAASPACTLNFTSFALTHHLIYGRKRSEPLHSKSHFLQRCPQLHHGRCGTSLFATATNLLAAAHIRCSKPGHHIVVRRNAFPLPTLGTCACKHKQHKRRCACLLSSASRSPIMPDRIYKIILGGPRSMKNCDIHERMPHVRVPTRATLTMQPSTKSRRAVPQDPHQPPPSLYREVVQVTTTSIHLYKVAQLVQGARIPQGASLK
jgi:hypothetical protein